MSLHKSSHRHTEHLWTPRDPEIANGRPGSSSACTPHIACFSQRSFKLLDRQHPKSDRNKRAPPWCGRLAEAEGAASRGIWTRSSAVQLSRQVTCDFHAGLRILGFVVSATHSSGSPLL